MSRRRKLLAVIAVVGGLMLIGTAAMAQEDPNTAITSEVAEAAVVIAAITFLAPVVMKLVERIRKYASGLQGDWITLVAIVLGTLIAAFFNLDPAGALQQLLPSGLNIPEVNEWVGFLAAGIWMAMKAGVVNDQIEAARNGHVEFDPGYVDGVRTPAPGEHGHIVH